MNAIFIVSLVLAAIISIIIFYHAICNKIQMLNIIFTTNEDDNNNEIEAPPTDLAPPPYNDVVLPPYIDID